MINIYLIILRKIKRKFAPIEYLYTKFITTCHLKHSKLTLTHDYYINMCTDGDLTASTDLINELVRDESLDARPSRFLTVKSLNKLFKIICLMERS